MPLNEPKISMPEQFELTTNELFYSIVKTTSFSGLFDDVCRLLDAPNLRDVQAVLADILPSEFEVFLHLLHMTMFTQSIHTQAFATQDTTPVTHAMQHMLDRHSVADVLKKIPVVLIDVLTAHPVDMDRGIIAAHKQQYAALCREWELQKQAFTAMSSTPQKMAVRSELNRLHHAIRNMVLQLLFTPNYRPIKIRPESEQRHLSRAIKEFESNIVQHWDKLIVIAQVMCFQKLLQECMDTDSALDTPHHRACLALPHTKETRETLIGLPCISGHALCSGIRGLSDQLTYQLETWRADMDGNPFVTDTTMALSIAYGRKRCFERLSADDAVIRYSLNDPSFQALQATMRQALAQLLSTGQPAWKAYIKDRQSAGWAPEQIYSGLAYFRMVELTEGAEQFSRTPNDSHLLKRGYETDADFLAFTHHLEALEQLVGIDNGCWTHARKLVKMRGLSLGKPHIRNGESLHLELLQGLGHAISSHGNVVDELTAIHSAIQPILLAELPTKNTNELLMTYVKMMAIDSDAILIQSDSGSELGSVEASIWLLKCVSKCIGHRGQIVVLCESEISMRSAIDLMQEKDASFFDGVMMMCAGSDNQKKMGPFYSAVINQLFLDTAHKKGILAFFGAGDSPFRSALHTPVCTRRTFQPGSRKRYFFDDHIYGYLSNRLAGHVMAIQGEPPLNMRLMESLGGCMLASYKASIATQTQLHHSIQAIAEIVTTYFSRPSTKGGAAGLAHIRAIDSARAQLILNTVDPQLCGVLNGLSQFFNQMDNQGIPRSDCHRLFNGTAWGQSMLHTLAYFANILDDELGTDSAIRSVSQRDILTVYEQLSGTPLTVTPDRHLKLSRQVWQYVSTHPELSEYNAQTLILFGANWMV
jgi:hypothetical protein